MIKRHLAGLIVAAVVAGSGAAAVAAAPDGGSGGASAGTRRPKPPKEQVKACREAHQAGQEPSAECQRLRAQAQKRQRGPVDRLENRAVHGDLIVRTKDGKFENVTMDKGIVQAKGDRTLTLKRPDGPVVTLKVNDATEYRGVADFAAIETGKGAVVLSHDGVAKVIAQKAPGSSDTNGGIVGQDEEQVPAT